MSNPHNLQAVTGDGGAEPAGEELLTQLKGEIQTIRASYSSAVIAQRADNAAVRFCQWNGQSTDGRKHKTALGKDPFPFENASDTRVRLADKIIQEHVQEYVTAAMRSHPRVIGTGSEDARQAAAISNLLRWLVNNQWGEAYRAELELLGQWMEGDTPAVAICGVWWKRELAVQPREVTLEDVMEAYRERLEAMAEETGEDVEGAAEELVDVMTSPGRQEEFEALLTGLYPQFDAKRIRKAVRELQEDGTTELPMPYVCGNYPEIEALRLYEDVFFRANVRSVQAAPAVFLRRWMTKAQVIERAEREEWKPAFVNELLGNDPEDQGKMGLSAFDDETLFEETTSLGSPFAVQERDGLYEVIWAYTRQANRDGYLGVFQTIFSGSCATAATGRKLLDYRHGKFPFVDFPRERLTRRLCDSRSISELVLTDQNSLKLVNDSIEDHVQVTTNPPIKKPRGSAKFQQFLTPFGEIEELSARQPIEFLKRPDYPKAASDHRDYIMVQVDDYMGRQNPALPEARSEVAQQFRVDRFLGCLKEALTQALQLCQQWMTDEDLMRVAKTTFVGRSVEEIQGKFDLQLYCDMRDMDHEHIQKKGELLLKYLRPMDAKGELPWGDIARNMIEAIDPHWADMLPPAEENQKRIRDEEDAALLKILAGIEPDMPEMIEAPDMRLALLQERLAPRMQNPEAFGEMSAAVQALIENRMQYLTQQATQAQNAVIGRIGAKPVELEALDA
jgi:hypothetical protein